MNTQIVDLTKKLGDTGYELRPALCLDLDGTVRRSKSNHKGFIKDLDDMELMPGIEEKIQEFLAAGYVIFGITNQGGVACGYKTQDDVYAEIMHMLNLFKGKLFSNVYAAQSWEKGTVEPYCHRSLLRKPDIGMLVHCETEAMKKGVIIDWDNSLFVGDRDDDKECANRARVKFMHIDEFLTPVNSDVKEVRLPETLDEAVKYLLPRFRDAKTWPEFEQGEDSFAAMCHSVTMGGIGMKIRNELKLWQQETPLHQFFLTHHNLFDPDEMSDCIIRSIYQQLKTQPASV